VADRDRLAIIIVTYNSVDEIDACLHSLVGHTSPFPTTITVVDNASRDGTADHVRKNWPSVQVIDSGGNLGFAKANNIGIRADEQRLRAVDESGHRGAARCRPDAGARTGVESDAAIAGARLLSESGFPELSWGVPINPWNELRTMIFSRLYLRKIRLLVRRMDKLSRSAREVAWVSGACMAIRRPDLDAVGLLDERYFMYNEDVDLCLAMKKRGRRVVYVAGSEVLHYRGKSAAQNPEMERLRQQSHVAYYEKHLPMWTPLLRIYLKITGKA
jgi:GT2 family glycosyltransferase